MEEADLANTGFSRWRSYLWPIHSYELKKLIPMLFIFFLLSFNYNVLRVMKDTLVVTGANSGPEAIPFIKVWVMFPGAILMTFLFTRFSNRFSRQSVFYLMITLFLLFFFIFTFFLYPARETLHPHGWADYLQQVLPLGAKGFVAMFRNWTFTLFYAMSELWGNIVLFVLFWGFANQVIRLGEAKRFYGVLGVGANLSGIFAGKISVWFSRHIYNPNFFFGENAWEQTMVMLICLVLLSGVLAMVTFYWMHRENFSVDEAVAAKTKQKEEKLSFRGSLKYVFNSRYLLSIAVIVIGYNLVINLVEVLWKHQVKSLYPEASQYSLYMNEITVFIGIIATLASLLISGNSIRKFGWTFTAMITPTILLVTSIGFFSCFFLSQYSFDTVVSSFGVQLLPMVVMFGSAQNILSRGAKYSVFDATKEMAFIPLGDECKIKGKAAIDGIGARLGKSGGSIIQQVLLLMFTSITASAPVIALILFGVIVLWFISVRTLGRQFNDAIRSENQVTTPTVTAVPALESAG